LEERVRRVLVAGNWKMNGGREDARRWVDAAVAAAREATAEVALFPPYPWLTDVAARLTGTPVRLGAQACHAQPFGAFTGGVSAAMLKDAGCTYVLCGHSERRTLAGETDAVVADAMRRAYEVGLTPVLCVGETAAERRAHRTRQVLATQVGAGLEAARGHGPALVLAYEPVWAIGTGVTATPAEAREAHGWIRHEVGARDAALAEGVRILYGGSVKADKIDGLLAQPDVDGVLVGGASLVPAEFAALVRARRPA
jgi:triosephosphate isomerase